MTEHVTTYRNPWHRPGQSRAKFTAQNAPVFTHRGVQVFRSNSGEYDFVLNGCCITQRAGRTDAEAVINDLLDGRAACCQAVAEHLEACGHSPTTYTEALRW